MMNSQAAKASPRWALLTATRTIWSAGQKPPHPVDDQGVVDIPPGPGVADDGGQRLLGHPR